MTSSENKIIVFAVKYRGFGSLSICVINLFCYCSFFLFMCFV
uniref:Uncharacterized protein n=1 Tax=Anguilla anguilla TaxID=7936 RepID=A0A0E9T006_ANGAN